MHALTLDPAPALTRTSLVAFARRVWFDGKNTLAPLSLRLRLGPVLCRIALWDCFEYTNASFGGCYEAAQKTRSKCSPSNSLIGPKREVNWAG